MFMFSVQEPIVTNLVPDFKRGHQDLLQYIHRKKTGQHAEEKAIAKATANAADVNDLTAAPGVAVDLRTLLDDVAAVRAHQTSISTDLRDLAESNKQLWAEAIQSRQRHQKHQDTINKIVRFLGSVFGGKVLSPLNSPAPSPTTNVSENHPAAPGIPHPRRQRLLLKDVPENLKSGSTSPRVQEIEVPLDELEDLPLISSNSLLDDLGASRFSTLADSPSNTSAATPRAGSPAFTNDNNLQLQQIEQILSPTVQNNAFDFSNPAPFTGPSEPQNQQLQRINKDHSMINSQMDTLQANLDRLVAGLNLPSDPQSTDLRSGEDDFGLGQLNGTPSGAEDFDLDTFLKSFGTEEDPTNAIQDLSSYFNLNEPPIQAEPLAEADDMLTFDDILVDGDGNSFDGFSSGAMAVDGDNELRNGKKRSSSAVSDSTNLGGSERRSSPRKKNKQ